MLLAAGCATAGFPPLRCPARGGPAWTEITSDHFVVWTDLERAEARRALEDLEWTRAAILGAAWQEGAGPTTRLGLVLLRSEGELRAFTRGEGWVVPDPYQPRLVLSGDSRPFPPQAVVRELAQHFSALALLRQPLWMREGLAAYLETVTRLPDSPSALVGLPSRWARLLGQGRVPARDILRWGDREEPGMERDPEALRAWSWLLVHFLVDDKGGQFVAYQSLLGRMAPPGRSWREAFPEYDPHASGGLARLDRDLAEYAALGRFRKRAIPVTAAPGSIAEHPMPDAEVHVTLAILHLSVPPGAGAAPEVRRAAAAQETAEALRQDPVSESALLVAIWLAPEAERPARARAAAAALPRSWRCWLALGRTLRGGPDRAGREAALRKALQLAPEEPATLSALAWELVESGRPAEALPLAEKAVARSAWKALALDVQAAALAGAGKCLEALPVQRRVVEILPDWTPKREQGELLERLAAYEARCGPGAEPQAGPRQ
jgi:hypothetical protein